MVWALLFMLIFGGTEYFYLASFDKNINKYVDDKETKKELQSYIKDYKKAVKEFNKKHSKQLKLFKEKNLDKTTTKQWYQAFFKDHMELRRERQERTIELRVLIQPKITDDEWQNIVAAATKETSKALEKKEKKEMKHKDKPADQKFTKTVEKYISEEEKNKRISEAYEELENATEKLNNSYDNINVLGNNLLIDKYASREDMQAVADSLNKLRSEMYESFLGFLDELKESTNDEEWEAIMKDFNKAMGDLK